jgi:hypothetical protein
MIIGISIRGTVFTEKGFHLITFLWWALYLGCVILFVTIPNIGKYAVAGFQFIWIGMQSMNFFASKEGIANYNKNFKNTHHVIKPSNKFLVPDTAHLILFALLLSSFAFTVIRIFI